MRADGSMGSEGHVRFQLMAPLILGGGGVGDDSYCSVRAGVSTRMHYCGVLNDPAGVR